MSIVPSPKVNAVSVNCWHVPTLLGMFLRLSFMNFQIKDGDTFSKNTNVLLKSPCKLTEPFCDHRASEFSICISLRHDSLNSRNRSIAVEFNTPPNSESVLFDVKYVSRIISNYFFCFFDDVRTRIRLIKAYTFTKSHISALLCPSASA